MTSSPCTTEDLRVLSEVADYIDKHAERLITKWETFVIVAVKSSHAPNRSSLRNHLAELLRDLGSALRSVDGETDARRASEKCFDIRQSENHGKSRATETSYHVYEVLKEYVILRHVLTDEIERAGLGVNLACIEAINRMFELASLNAVKVFTDAVTRNQRVIVSTLIHDVRSPLSVAASGLELIESSGGDAEEFKNVFPMVHRSVHKVLDMIPQLLDGFSEMESGCLTFYFTKCDLAPFFEEALNDLRGLFGDRLCFDIPAQPIEGIFDREMLLRVLNNLIGNAFKHGDQFSPVRVAIHEKDSLVHFVVHNKGRSITQTQRDRIFAAYNSVNPTKKGRGWGLGLTHVKSTAEAHGGRVEWRSSDSEGTTFEVIVNKNHAQPGTVSMPIDV